MGIWANLRYERTQLCVLMDTRVYSGQRATLVSISLECLGVFPSIFSCATINTYF